MKNRSSISALPEFKPTHNDSLTAVEVEVINFFVHAAQGFGLPKSIGEIYGLLFCAPEPLAFDDIVSKLKISKGSASQGLRFLRNVNAVKTLYMAGDRRDHYEAEIVLSNLASGFLREKIKPHLESGEARLAVVRELVQKDKGKENHIIKQRVNRLIGWNRKAKKILPTILRLVG